MNFVDAIKLGFSNYVNFTGRACRSEYWYWVLFTVIVSVVTLIIDSAIGAQVTSTIWDLATFLPSLALAVRRLHDLDRSGWWFLLILIPLVGIIILIVWFCSKGSDGPNRFGPDRLLGMAPPIPRPAA
jgi:uncharacterized membrane protein YhaH (DUF805 family)